MTATGRLGRTSLAISALVLLLPTGAARAETTAGLGFEPATGLDSVPLTAVSTGTCTDPRGTNLQLRITGAGFPAGTNVTPNLSAAIYPIDPTTGGYDVPLQNTLQAFAAQQTPPAVLRGTYTFTLICRSASPVFIYQDYTGSIVFSSPTHYQAAAASLPPVAEPSMSVATPSMSVHAPATSSAPASPAVVRRLSPTTAGSRAAQAARTPAADPVSATPAPVAPRTPSRRQPSAGAVSPPAAGQPTGRVRRSLPAVGAPATTTGRTSPTGPGSQPPRQAAPDESTAVRPPKTSSTPSGRPALAGTVRERSAGTPIALAIGVCAFLVALGLGGGALLSRRRRAP